MSTNIFGLVAVPISGDGPALSVQNMDASKTFTIRDRSPGRLTLEASADGEFPSFRSYSSINPKVSRSSPTSRLPAPTFVSRDLSAHRTPERRWLAWPLLPLPSPTHSSFPDGHHRSWCCRRHLPVRPEQNHHRFRKIHPWTWARNSHRHFRIGRRFDIQSNSRPSDSRSELLLVFRPPTSRFELTSCWSDWERSSQSRLLRPTSVVVGSVLKAPKVLPAHRALRVELALKAQPVSEHRVLRVASGAQAPGGSGPQGSTRGAQGAQGAAGAQGSAAAPQGTQGLSGAQGAQGFQGSTGTQGTQGFQGSVWNAGLPG